MLVDVDLVNRLGIKPLFRIDARSGNITKVPDSGVTGDAAISDARGEVLHSLMGYEPHNYSLGTYRPETGKVVALPSKPGGYFGFVISPKGNRVAAYFITAEERNRMLTWQFDRMAKKPTIKPPQIRINAVLIDLAKRKVSFTGIQGVPLCWSVDGQTACFRTAKGILGYNVASGKKTTISPRMDIGYAKWSAPLNGYVALVFRKGKLVLDLTDQIFTTKRTLGDCPRNGANLIMSPGGTKIAYCNEDAYFIFTLEDGTLSQLKGQTGDLDPAWLDEDSLIIGDSTGEINVVNIDGSTEKSYHVHALKRKPKAN